MHILHITAHLGGGAGKAISGIAIEGQRSFADTHRILLLQEPEKNGYVRECLENGVAISVWDGGYEAIQWADVVVVSWWNHPTMAHFLRGFSSVKIPLVLWSHVNGCHYPLLPHQFVSEFDKVLFTSPYSLENPTWTQPERQTIRAQAEIVWGMGRFAPSEIIPKSDYQARGAFTVGYVGTLNYGKIHPDFTSFCKEACTRVPNIKFVLAGDRDGVLENDIRSAGLADQVAFAGFVSNVPALMRSFDVFGYLLNPEHYGTTENVLLEAMACGLPVIAMRQNVEQYIVPPEAGQLVETAVQYGQQLEILERDTAKRKQMGHCARSYVVAQYCSEENTARFREACRQTEEKPARTHDFSWLGESAWEWFLFFLDERNRKRLKTAWDILKLDQSAGTLGEVKGLLQSCPPILWEERKSSLRHFAAIYPQSQPLQELKNVMEQGKG